MRHYQLVIVGGGPAGLSAGVRAKELGADDILIIERNKRLGGILKQCIHPGFGLQIFKEELTGPEYAQRFTDQINALNIPYQTQTFVTNISKNNNKAILTLVSEKGAEQISASAVILAMGCRERPRGAISIPGSRPSGIYTAGLAQELINIKNQMPGREFVILGSGDIGLIMARRLTLEGAKVKCVIELMPYSSGLKRNIVQCLNDFNIPLMLGHTITNIIGRDRVEGVYISAVDENRNPVGNEKFITCDTVLLSVGLIPENELSKEIGVELSPITGGAVVDCGMETNIEGIYSCGNALHVHDLADNVTLEAYEAAESAVSRIFDIKREKRLLPVKSGKGIRYVLPQYVDINTNKNEIELKLRVSNVYHNCFLSLYAEDLLIEKRKKRSLTPGEMERIIIKRDKFSSFEGKAFIEVRVDE